MCLAEGEVNFVSAGASESSDFVFGKVFVLTESGSAHIDLSYNSHLMWVYGWQVTLKLPSYWEKS